MKKSLEDIRSRYSGKRSSEGDSSKTASRPSAAQNCHQASKEVTSSSRSNSSIKSETLGYPQPTNHTSIADFSKIEFSSSVIANELGLMYVNETVNLGTIFSSPGCDSSSDERTSTDSCQNAKTQTFSPTSASKTMETSSLVENAIHQSNLDFSQTDSPSIRAGTLKTDHTSEPARKTVPGPLTASDQGDGTPACQTSKNQIPNYESRSVICGAVADSAEVPSTSSSKCSTQLLSGVMIPTTTNQHASAAACKTVKKLTALGGEPKPLNSTFPNECIMHQPDFEFSKMDFSPSSADTDLNLLYVNESTRNLFPGLFKVSGHRDTTGCHVTTGQISQTLDLESKSEVFGPTDNATNPSTISFYTNICSSRNDETAENQELVANKLSQNPLSDGVRYLNSHVKANISETSQESFQNLMFDQLDQFAKPDAMGHSVQAQSIGQAVDSLLSSEEVNKNNNVPLMNLKGESCGHHVDEVVNEIISNDGRTPAGPQKSDDSVPHLASSARMVAEVKSFGETIGATVKTIDEAASSSFDAITIIGESGIRPQTNSCSVEELDVNMKPDMIGGINVIQHAVTTLRENAKPEISQSEPNLPQTNERQSEVPCDLDEETSDDPSMSFCYSDFTPHIHNTLSITEFSQGHPLQSLLVITGESQETGVVSQDPSNHEVISDTSVADPNAINPDGSGISSQEGKDLLLTSSSMSVLMGSSKSKYFDCSGNVPEYPYTETARHSFFKALPADELLAESGKITLDSYGNCVDEAESYDLPTPNDYLEHNWLPQKISRLVLGTSGCCYEGHIYNSQMHGHGRFYFGKDQYIEGKWETNSLVHPNACHLTVDSRNISVFNTSHFYLVTIFEFDFVAKAISNSFKDLDFNASVARIKASFLRKFKILETLSDEMRPKGNLLLKEFKEALHLVNADDTDVVMNATILFLLGKSANSLDVKCALLDVQRSDVFPPALRTAAANLLEFETSLHQRNQVISFYFTISELAPHFDVREIMFNKYADQVAEHRRALLSKCPSNFPELTEMIQKLPGETILYTTRDDVGVFHHLFSLPCAKDDETFKYTQNLFGVFLEQFSMRLRTIRTGTPPDAVIPLTSSVFGYLYRSFSNIVEDIVGIADECHFQDMLAIDQHQNWKLKGDIRWSAVHESKPAGSYNSKSKQNKILYRKSLEAQYHAIYQMLIFFSPGNYLKGRMFTYDFHVLKFDPSWWLRTPSDDDDDAVLFGLADLEGLSNDRLAWLYILDNTVHKLFKDDPRTLNFIKLYNPLLQGYISFLQKSDADTHESFRVLMHSIVQFLVSSIPYFTKTIERQSLDFEVLSHQMWTMKMAARDLELGPASFTHFRDLIEEYKRYWTHRPSMDGKSLHESHGYFASQIHAMKLKFGEIVRISLAEDVPIINLVKYLRTLNDFMADFKIIDFMNCWFVKSDIYDHTVMEKIDNKISASKHCSYRVTNIHGFVKLMEGNPIPNHYIIAVVTRLIEYVIYFFSRSWSDGNKNEGALNIERLESTGMLLDAIRQSFMYLKEQPEYVDFETFMKESTEPFMRIVYESKDLNDIKNRTDTLKESFWYIRNMDGIGIDKAITLFSSVNDCPISDKLSNSYNLYLEHYNRYIETYCSQPLNAKHDKRLDAVRRKMKMPRPLHFSKWSEGYKIREIPKMLAGLSAVWSILVSKDVSSAGKFLKPHCVQILCVMRLLSIDKSEGAENHLAQVLTGQGKSLILGLLSSVLALTGHRVRVVCYSEYLSTRDKNDFMAFFQQFGITDSISYGTFQDMANGFLNPLCNGKRTSLRKMVSERVLNHRNWISLGSVKTESSDTVLLIDEVDVFFNDKFYGNCYDSLTTVHIPGLGDIQYAMWKIAKDGEYNAVQIKRLVEKHICEQLSLGVPLYQEWEAFCNKSGTFHLLVDGSNGESQIKEYTNRSLTEEHLMKMAEDALVLGRNRELDHLFKLNDEGLICMRNSAGQYLSGKRESYRNTFAYFKLKDSDYLSLDFRNFGYLLLKTGKISYARLPCHFPLIMGVSGTLKNLSEYEKVGIGSYNIKEFSIIPSFFGESNLKFNEDSDFTFAYEQQVWLNEIYHKANEMVQSLRAVLIFFDLDVHLNLFAGEYKTKFDRVNEITPNTDRGLRDLYINEAGISCTVTLATRDMGRGLDYKSSLAVEKNGGIHVIQTFFSVDIKEEIQIRGRTARQGNRGSYELIICKEHLVQKKIILDEAKAKHTYWSLQPIRRKMMDCYGKRHAEMIMKSEHDHEITMMYYGLSQFDKTSTETIALSD